MGAIDWQDLKTHRYAKWGHYEMFALGRHWKTKFKGEVILFGSDAQDEASARYQAEMAYRQHAKPIIVSRLSKV